MAEAKPAGPLLNRADVQTTTWVRIKEYYESRLANLRMQNDASLSHDDTQLLRGRIREVKGLLKLDQEMPKFDFPATDGK